MRLLVTDQRAPMAPRSPRCGLRGRVRRETPAGAQAHEETDRQIRQGKAELDRIVARIEGENRPLVSEPACPSQERICSAATRFTFSPGMMRRTRRGAVQREQRSGTCASQEEFQPATMGCP